MTLAHWVALSALTVLVASQRTKRKACANSLLVVTLVPFHFAYAAVLVFGSVPD